VYNKIKKDSLLSSTQEISILIGSKDNENSIIRVDDIKRVKLGNLDYYIKFNSECVGICLLKDKFYRHLNELLFPLNFLFLHCSFNGDDEIIIEPCLNIKKDDNDTTNEVNVSRLINNKIVTGPLNNDNSKTTEQLFKLVPIPYEVFDYSRLFVRVDNDELPLNVLKNIKIAIMGLGSGGALLSSYLARSGIESMILIDQDRLETHNIIRHICKLNDIGCYKTIAVKRHLLSRIPSLQITTCERNFVRKTKKDNDFFRSLLSDTDLIISTTGEHGVNFSLNDFALSNQPPIPIIYAGLSEKVKLGIIIRVDPSLDDACYYCIYGKPEAEDIHDESKVGMVSVSPTDYTIPYDRTLEDELSQPGLALDIDNYTIILGKYILNYLLSGHDHGLYKLESPMYFWPNRDFQFGNYLFEGLELCYEDQDFKKHNCKHCNRNTN